jgi:cation diffusion facilitator family transporter
VSEKTKIARLSIFSNSLLILLKLLTGIISGSISIISEAIHSFMDLLAAVIAFFSVRISDTPADERHPYGHGKFENISGVVEALLIFIAALWIIYEAVVKFFHPRKIEAIEIGILVMIISALVNIFVSRKLYKVARRTESIALEADALHLKMDVYTSAGVASGLFLMWVGSFFIQSKLLNYLDPFIAVLVALLILKESYILFKKAYSPLLDVALSKEEIRSIRMLIDKYCSSNVSYHDLRTRKAGNHKYIDFHLNLSDDMHVREAHELCDTIENEIKGAFKNSEVTIHVENF